MSWTTDLKIFCFIRLRARQVMQCLPLLMWNNTEARALIATEDAHASESETLFSGAGGASCSSYITRADIYYGGEGGSGPHPGSFIIGLHGLCSSGQTYRCHKTECLTASSIIHVTVSSLWCLMIFCHVRPGD
ncbi:hypothetical protein SRHO_G00003650 [Serrasalmus rhombeus]